MNNLNKIFAICLFFLLIPFLLCTAQNKLKLGTASKSGSYYPLGESIKKVLGENDIEIEVLATNGSVENFNKLNESSLNLAIVQNDIAFYADNGLGPFEEKQKDLTGIITFYQEPIYLITNNSSLSDISSLERHKVNVGPEGGGLYADAKIILNSLQLWNSIYKRYHVPSQGIEKVLSGELDATFINNLPDSLSGYINDKELFLVSFDDNLIENLKNTYSHFSKYSKVINSFGGTTLCVKSMLVCKKTMRRDLVYEMTKILYENYDRLDFPDRIEGRNKRSVILGMTLDDWHPGAYEYFDGIGLMPSDTFLRIVWYLALLFLVLSLIVPLSYISLIFAKNRNSVLSRFNSGLINSLKKLRGFLFGRKYIVTIVIIVVLFVIDLEGIKYLEHIWAIENNSVSDFDNRSLVKNIIWLFVFGGSGYNSNLFPQNPAAQFLATLIPMIGLGGAIAMISFLTSDSIKRHILEMKGVKSKMFSNHIIICGWNKNVPLLLNDLLDESHTHIKPVVVLADIDGEYPLAKYGLNDTYLEYIRGDATKREDLERANFKEADIVVVVVDEKSTDPDALNILKILNIENYSLELEEKHIREKANIYSILELIDVNNSKLAKEAKVDEIISFSGVKTKLLVQSICNPGVSQFFNEILYYNPFNELYSLKIDGRCKQLADKTFDELLFLLRKQNILLVAINLKGYRNKAEVQKILDENGLKREVITNPVDEVENNYKTCWDDVLITIAEKEEVIDKFVNMLKKNKIEM